MEHHFDIDIAKQYGVYEAILINNFMFWIAKNKANNKHFYENRYWTYNSVKALSELFPYFSEGQVRRVIDNLVIKEVLIKGNFNQNPYDKTLWYAIDESKISNLRINQYDLMKSTNGYDEIDKSFTDKKLTDKKTIKKQLNYDSSNLGIDKSNLSENQKTLLREWLKYKYEVKKEVYETLAFITKYENDIKEYGFESIKSAIKLSIANEYKGYFPKPIQSYQKTNIVQPVSIKMDLNTKNKNYD